jgi:pilus assembly protein CpaF
MGTTSSDLISRTELLMTYIRGLEPLIFDPDVTEIMVVPNGRDYLTFVERNGVMEEIPDDLGIRESHLAALARDVARNQLGREIDEEDPALSATLENGSRIAIVIPPASEGIVLTIRNFRERHFTVEELISKGAITEPVAKIAQQAIFERRNILISGANGTGKTTMLNALASAYIPKYRRVVVIEDEVREIRLPEHRNKLHLRAGVHATMSRLVREALRHRIQHVVVGEVLGAEGLDLLTALNTGHSGSFATLHADSAALALHRLTTCVVAARSGLTYEAIRMMMGDSIHYVMHLQQNADGRRHVSEFVKVEKYDPATDTFHCTAAG